MSIALAKVMPYLENIVDSGGPKRDEYGSVIHALDVIHKHEFSIVDGRSERANVFEPFSDFIRNNWSIFRTTLSMQGFSFAKPHGYAGDFEIIERIYGRMASHHPNILNWDLFFHAGVAPNAVRNRAEILRNLVEEMSPRELISVGCGPALDVFGAFAGTHFQPKVSFLDNDAKALERAKVNMSVWSGEKQFVQRNALRFRSESDYDLIWSAGLFDYLNDKAGVFLLKRLKEMLKPHGKLALGNFSHENASRSYMELIGEWFLVHRTKDDLMRLAGDGGFSKNRINVFADDTGVNLFLIAENA